MKCDFSYILFPTKLDIKYVFASDTFPKPFKSNSMHQTCDSMETGISLNKVNKVLK